MTIWRCVNGGFHDGQDCAEEFSKLLKHTTPIHDIEMVRLSSVDEVDEFLNFAGWSNSPVDREDIATVLSALAHLTPDFKDDREWKKLGVD